MTKVRGLIVGALVLVITIGIVGASAPRARASDTGMWELAFASQCAAGAACGGFTTGQGWCTFIGTASSGSQATCSGSFKGDLGVLTATVHGTAWDVETSPAPPLGTGLPDFFVTDGTVTYGGQEVVLLLAFGVPVPPACTVTGQTITCPIPAVTQQGNPDGIYNPDTLNPVIPGHYAADVCFATGTTDPACSYVSQLTFVS